MVTEKSEMGVNLPEVSELHLNVFPRASLIILIILYKFQHETKTI